MTLLFDRGSIIGTGLHVNERLTPQQGVGKVCILYFSGFGSRSKNTWVMDRMSGICGGLPHEPRISAWKPDDSLRAGHSHV
jgi:hypothetical protein